MGSKGGTKHFRLCSPADHFYDPHIFFYVRGLKKWAQEFVLEASSRADYKHPKVLPAPHLVAPFFFDYRCLHRPLPLAYVSPTPLFAQESPALCILGSRAGFRAHWFCQDKEFVEKLDLKTCFAGRMWWVVQGFFMLMIFGIRIWKSISCFHFKLWLSCLTLFFSYFDTEERENKSKLKEKIHLQPSYFKK